MPKNILILLADQFRADCLGGRYPVKTPNLDSLIGSGMLFTKAYTPMPVCAPARQALLCGRHPDSFNATWNYDMLPCGSLVPGNTWSQGLKAQGYSLGYLGKWHCSPEYLPKDFGFDHYVEKKSYDQMLARRYPHVKFSGDWLGEESPIPLEDSLTHWLADQANEFITSRSSPWAAFVDFSVPHLPCRPSEPFSKMYKPGDTISWDGFGDTFVNKPYIHAQQPVNWGIEDYSWDDFAPGVARYYAMISQLDDAVGKVLRRLEDSGQRDDTMIIFTSDHGDMCGSHGMLDKHYVLYEDVTRVPLVISYLGAKGTCDGFISNCLDIPATLNEIFSLGMKGFHGRSLLPVLLGRAQDFPDYITSSGNGQQFGLFTSRMIRRGQYKYVWNCTDIDELYDLSADPGEKNNLIKDDKLNSLLSRLRRLLYDECIQHEDHLVKLGWLDNQLLNGKKL